MAQDLELGRREADPAVAALYPSPLEVDDEVRVPDDPAAGLGSGHVPSEPRSLTVTAHGERAHRCFP